MISAIVIGVLMVAAASSGGLFKPGGWYRSLNRPRWTPPDWLFPVVWTPLYFMIGYAGWLAWDAQLTLAMLAWAGQLVCNALWSYFFFGRRDMRLAMIDVTLLQIMVLTFIVACWPSLRLGALLFVPYAIWVTIAASLNLRMIQLNPDQTQPAA